MIGDKARECLSDHLSAIKLNPRLLISFTLKTRQTGENPLNNRDLKFTDGLYAVTYSPSKGPNTLKNANFLISCDMFYRKGMRAFNYKSFKKNINEDPVVDFLVNWTTLTEELFDIAKANLGTRIPFSLDVVKYYRAIKEKDPDIGFEVFTEEGMTFYEQKRREIEREIAWAGQIAKIEV